MAAATAPFAASAAAQATDPRPPFAMVHLQLAAPSGVAGGPALARRLRESPPATLARAAELVGLFTPQLGWAGNEAALLVRWSQEADRAAALAAITALPGVLSQQARGLTPTVRPAPATAFRPGGVHVHRWFTIRSADLDDFVALSEEGWADFETRFDARVHGLFVAEAGAGSVEGELRLLLLTRYGSHAVWEASRDPSTAGMQSFAKRRALTRHTIAASTLALPLRNTVAGS